jgi:hypothetical protein
MHIRGCQTWVIAALALCAGSSSIPARADDPPARGTSKSDYAVRFDVPKTVARVGHTRVIPFRLAAPAAKQQNLETSIQGDAARVVRGAEVLAGYDLGFARIVGDHAGTCTLNIQGTELTIEVIDEPAPVAHAELSPSPRIVTPSPGATVWGDFSVGVEWFAGAHDPAMPAREVALLLPDGQTLAPTSMSNFGSSPHWVATFNVSSAKLPVGDVVVRAALIGARGEKLMGPPIALRTITPSAEQVTKIEAEDWAAASRPAGFSRGTLSVGNEPACSGGKFVGCTAADPVLTYTVELTRPGRYQAMATVAADVGGAGLPVVGLVMDGAQYAQTSGRLAQAGWHRIAVGAPVSVAPGFRAFSFRFDNDSFYPPKNDRNLRIDSIELVRLDGPAGPDLIASASGDAMMAPAMNAPGGDAMMAPQATVDTRMDVAASAGSINAADMMQALSATSLSEGNDADFSTTRPVRIAFERVLHGSTVIGELEIDGVCAWDNQEKSPAPVTVLMLNGREHSRQRSLAPRFWVDQSQLMPGENTVQLIARADSGAISSTCAQTIIAPPGAGSNTPAVYRRYSVRDGAWASSVREQAKAQNDNDEKRRVTFAPGADGSLRLDDELTGTFRVLAECRSGAGKAGGKLRFSRDGQTGGTWTSVQNWWDTLALGTIELAPGTKSIKIESEQAKGPPGVDIAGVILQRVPEASVAPSAEIVYPRELPSTRAQMWQQDAVVVEARSPRGLRSAEVLIDNKSIFGAMDITRQGGPITLPLLLRGLAPGSTHELRVKLVDLDGRETITPTRSITLATQEPSEPNVYERAIFLLDRFGFGYSAIELGAILTQGEEAWLRDRLSRAGDDPSDRAAFELACARYPSSRNTDDVQRRAAQLAIASGNPARARFLLWCSNHFTTWIRKVEADVKWPEFASFQRLGVARFDDLLYASATSPAMLRYLDQERSVAGRLNENYAREVMELHTLGVHGGYTQSDVTSLAKILNGWTTYTGAEGRGTGGVRDLEFRYDPSLNDGQEQTVFGMGFAQAEPGERFDRVRAALEMLAAHPSTARFVCRSLCDHYVSVDAPQSLIDDLAREFETSGGDMRRVLMAMARHPLFWSSATRIAQPVDFCVRLQRVSASPQANLANDYLRRTRQALFDCPTPNGYSDKDEDYVDSNAMLQRLRLARDSMYGLAGLVPNPMRYAPEDAKWLSDDWAQRVVDLLAVRITGRVLGETSNAAALKIITESTGNRDARVREAAAFVGQSPEASVR